MVYISKRVKDSTKNTSDSTIVTATINVDTDLACNSN